jgi:hypothetical protein
LETVDENGTENRHVFLENGGEVVELVPCLNDDPVGDAPRPSPTPTRGAGPGLTLVGIFAQAWCAAAATLIREEAQGW